VKHIKIYTDGACRGNPGPGGWAALLRFGDQEKIIKGAETLTTNNRMELIAAIQGIMAIKEKCIIDLYTDSQYVQRGVTEWLKGWKARGWKKADKKPIKNDDLWKTMDQEIENHHISWHWVKGHSGHPENELVDEMANKAIDEMLAK
jgi:ribonuclease HI